MKNDTILSQLDGTKLLKKKSDDLIPILDIDDHFKNKVIALYFSAHWCPPCQKFTPILKVIDIDNRHFDFMPNFFQMFYEEVGDSDFEIIFFSRDRTRDEYNNYFNQEHGDWYAVPFGDALIE
jgi:nucleoredoxin